MRPAPPPPLVELLDRLALASERQVAGVYRRAVGLARGLPLFESVWVDALAQARVLTAFQAKEINAGRGDALAVGPYVLQQPLAQAGYADFYRARHRESGELVRLAVIDLAGADPAPIATGLERLVAASAALETECLAPIRQSGVEDGRAWAASEYVAGKTAAEWMVHNGRFPPEVVLEIARQMLPGLVALETAGLCHGDLGAAALVLCDDGRVVMPAPGLRSLLRPKEGYAQTDLRPEAYDYLAPERIADGTPPSVASELYACGCLWWHLLTGRAPVPGGTSLAKLQAAQTVRVPDVARLAPEVSSPLAAAVAGCLQKQPSRRPDSIAQLAARLGPSTHVGRMGLARCLRSPARRSGHVWSVSMRTIRHSSQTPMWLAGIAGCLVAAVALGWSIRNSLVALPPASIPAPPGPAEPAEPPIQHPTEVEPPPADRVDMPAPDRKTEPAEPMAAPVERSQPDVDPIDSPPIARPAESPSAVPDKLLPADTPVEVDRLDLQPGQRVCGAAGRRPLLVVPQDGLTVAVEGVRFENIDFVLNDQRPGTTAAGQVVALTAGQASFHGCSFQSVGTSAARAAAIRWTHPVDRAQAELTLPSGRLELRDCVFSGVGAAIDCRTLGARAMRLVNTLHVGDGPLVRIDRYPRADEPFVLSLSHVAVRAAPAVIECRMEPAASGPGRISVEASQCAFALGPRGALWSLIGPEPGGDVLTGIQWTGQGSLLGMETSVARWSASGGDGQVLDDAALSIAGLVRSKIEFAGGADEGPAASRVTQWQGPALSTDAPGIDPAALVLPKVEVRRAARFDNRPR